MEAAGRVRATGRRVQRRATTSEFFSDSPATWLSLPAGTLRSFFQTMRMRRWREAAP